MKWINLEHEIFITKKNLDKQIKYYIILNKILDDKIKVKIILI